MNEVDTLAHGVLDLANYFERQNEIADTSIAKRYATGIINGLDMLAWTLSANECVCGMPLTGDAELCAACAMDEKFGDL